MSEQDKINWYKNGKFTAITSLIILLFAMFIWSSAFFIYVLHDSVIEHEFIRNALYNVMWYFGAGIGSFCVGALLRRGWTFFNNFFKSKPNQLK